VKQLRDARSVGRVSVSREFNVTPSYSENALERFVENCYHPDAPNGALALRYRIHVERDIQGVAMKILVLMAAMALTPIFAASPPGFAVWKDGDLKVYEKKLSAKMNPQKAANEDLAKFATSRVLVVHREGDGAVEIHANEGEYFIVESGHATLIVGGSVENQTTASPGEFRGTGIRGGERTQLGAGDVVHIPENTPHQLLIAVGGQFTYVVVKELVK
jgi:mannose-6-phosphate isomerase-like protein (cupin superfamily)